VDGYVSTPLEKRPYHRRDLRQALIRSALEILAGSGVTALSLRAAARRAKVSAMAPYRHFADKEALLAAVAEYGFRELATRLTAASTTAPDPRAGLAAQGVAYVLFAREQPSLFRLMFGPTIERKSEHPALNEAGNACFDALRQAVAAAKFFASDAAANDVALACWSLVHGLSALIVDGRLAEADAGAADAVATRLTHLLSDSLAALGEKVPAASDPSRNSTPIRKGGALRNSQPAIPPARQVSNAPSVPPRCASRAPAEEAPLRPPARS
jgi:AcrR family transcriptional regulator